MAKPSPSIEPEPGDLVISPADVARFLRWAIRCHWPELANQDYEVIAAPVIIRPLNKREK